MSSRTEQLLKTRNKKLEKQLAAKNLELKIEASLENVRRSALAMNQLSDMLEVCRVIAREMKKLEIKDIRNVQTAIFNESKGTYMNYEYYARHDKKVITDVDYKNHPMHTSFASRMLKGPKELFINAIKGKQVQVWYDFQKTTNVFLDHYLETARSLNYYWYSLGPVAMGMSTYTPLKKKAINLLIRFANVFELAYRRWTDIEQAIGQAREATIEAALERVRAKAMAMHKSEDLANAVSIVFEELDKLDLNMLRCGITIINRENNTGYVWSTLKTEKGLTVQVAGDQPVDIHPLHQGTTRAWINQEDYSHVLSPGELKSYYKTVATTNFKLPDLTEDESAAGQYYYFAPFSAGGLYAFRQAAAFSEEAKNIIRRFANVFNLTYQRFLDLQQAEKQAREATIQAAFDRVRAEIASMRSVSDLDRITPLIWNELTILGVPFIRCGVFLMDESEKLIHTFLSTPDGKAIAVFQVPFDTGGNISQVVGHWRDRKKYVDHWDESNFTEFANILVKQDALASPDQYLKSFPQGGFYLHFLPFLQGMLYVGNTEPLGEEDLKLLQAVADAFSTAYARYEDFNKLEAAKQQVEKTLVELKQAQAQLVQSEKMAYLGELTAGIAHEIQNPLNFVNNFSEVNEELIDELQQEAARGNIEEIKAIASNIKENEQKIIHHGKRADAIVKGMLQHSQKSTGQKTPTDANALVDEYLRLTYHGFRAKKGDFQAKLITDFDQNIGMVNMVSPEIGRVLLNIYNNAFFAVDEKRKQHLENYEPTVFVKTGKSDGRLSISVRDNGNGIPQNIRDKIFQPFFTTKPTGQGTGLGLSLSYDIIQAHGGEIRLNTVEKEFTEIMILLPC